MPPSDEGKRSAVAVVNDSPVGCQSRDRTRRSEWAAVRLLGGRENRKIPFLWDHKQKTYSFSLPQSASLTAPSSEGALVWCIAKQQLIALKDELPN